MKLFTLHIVLKQIVSKYQYCDSEVENTFNFPIMDKLCFVVGELNSRVQLCVYGGTTKWRFQTIILTVRPPGLLGAVFIGKASWTLGCQWATC